MSVHYLMDLFTSPVTSAGILDVLDPVSNQSVMNGGFIVRVPTFAPIDVPSTPTLTNVLAAKHAAMLSYFTGYSNMKYDDMLDTSGIDLTATTTGVFGSRGCVALPPSATMQSVAISLGSTPANVVLTWEVFSIIDADPGTDRFTRKYNELSTISSFTTATVSTNNGSAYTAATDRAVTAISGPNQGNQLIVKITNASSFRLYLGGWALMY